MDLLAVDVTLPRPAFELRAALTLGSETLALVGPSGAGKTSLLRAIAGLERPHRGRICLGRETWFDAQRRIHLRPERRRVGYLPQDYGLFGHLSVAANVRFAAGRERPDLMVRFGIDHLAGARPGQLSSGERQRVALARALGRGPRVLLLDEPFGALDAITRLRVRDELADALVTLRLPALIVTHSFEDATAVAQRVGVIDAGRLVQVGAASELLGRPATAVVAGLTGANVLDGVARPAELGSTVQLSQGGELSTATAAVGPVQIAVHPWKLELADPATSRLIDTVVGVHVDRGSRLIRLTRLTVQTDLSPNGQATITPGMTIGLRAAATDVHVFGSPSHGVEPSSRPWPSTRP